MNQSAMRRQQSGTRTILTASEAPAAREWAEFVDQLLEQLAEGLGIEFPGGQHHTNGIFALGISGVYPRQEFSLWCDEPGQLILVHDHLRAQRVEILCTEIAALWSSRPSGPAA